LDSLQKIFISLGSNQGNRLENLQNAIDTIYQNIGNVLSISTIYETEAWGFESTKFLNCCIKITSDKTPEALLIALQEIEIQLGRQQKRSDTYEARPIDLDILFYGDDTVDLSHLQIPHLEVANRKFVLQPLADIAPKYTHSKFNKTVRQLLSDCNDNGEIKPITDVLNNPFDAHRFTNYNLITIEGNIGSGKTSLATKISEEFNAKLILERFADNAFLPKFYEDQTRFAFPLEMSFLADRYKQLSDDIAQYDLFKEFVVADYHISKSLTFAKVTLPEDEFDLYRRFFNVIYKDMQQPDLYVYLYQNTTRLLQNIEKRGREYEQNIQPDYLENINKGYVEFIKSQPQLNVKVIDVSELDFVKNRKDYLQVLDLILK